MGDEEWQRGYPTPLDSPRGEDGAGDSGMSEEGWAEWNDLTMGGGVERWEQEGVVRSSLFFGVEEGADFVDHCSTPTRCLH